MVWPFTKQSVSGFGFYSTAAEVTEGIDGSGLTAIITGGASGIGVETSKTLALRGVHVILAVRNVEAAETVKGNIFKVKSDAKIDILHLDLSSLASVRQFVSDFKAMNLPLNLLINNAGVMQCPFQLSKDGIELQFATNHLGHFLLTSSLLETMKSTALESKIEGRIVNLTSSYHKYTYSEGIRLDRINSPEGYSRLYAYGQSKLANLLHCYELARRLQEQNVPITINSVHPGYIFTNLQRHITIMAYIGRVVMYHLWKTPSQGAATTCYVALHPGVKGLSGKFFADCNQDTPSKFATNAKLAEDLWKLSEKMTNC
ncbi:hypothetical protein GOP47_0027912 [Adiantum capillus-veneris]|nr:hypothetical protein GOP47_0027912 [Adiantum capillus-veneris]